jgi:hypothetical protein
MTEIAPHQAEPVSEDDYYSILFQVVAAVSEDHAQLRAAIYELARLKLRRDLSRRFSEVGWAGLHERLIALDAAINQCEIDFQKNELRQAKAQLRIGHDPIGAQSVPSLPAQKPDLPKPLIVNDPELPLFYPLIHSWPRRTFSLPTIAGQGDRLAAKASRLLFLLPSTVQLVVAAALGAAIFTAIDGWLSPHGKVSNKPVAVNTLKIEPNNLMSAEGQPSSLKPIVRTPEITAQPIVPDMPMPSTYGVYAVSEGRLIELDGLPIKVPDPRIAISSEISTPSQAHLASGHLKFIIFRRDLISNAPDHADLRVVARIERALTFNSKGKPTVKDVADSWVVRGNSYPMRVGPVAQNQEMVLIQTEDPDFIFPAGRYALVFKTFAYDFSIDGPLTDQSHCLERTEAVNAPVYTECRLPLRPILN